jgi:hypothetical protein
MMHFTLLHWIVVVVFVLLFLVLSLLSLREKNTKTVLTMIFSSFLLTVAAAAISLVVLDKYTKKAKILTYTTQHDLARESVIVRGVIQNVGNYEIGYCNLEVRVSRNPKGGRVSSYFTPTKGLDFLSKKGGKTNSVTVEEEIAANLKPGEKKKFYLSVRFPTYFEDPKYFLKLHCH